MGFISVFTASYIDFIIISFLIIIHELGHFLAAKFLNIDVDKIIIYPLGGLSKFKMPLNISLIEEFLILIMGPIFQFIAYFILISTLKEYNYLINSYHFGILAFNLLPIYPLDGGKLINIILANKLSFKNSLTITILFSYIVILLLIFLNINSIYLNFIIIIIFLLYKVTKEYTQINFLYNKFLLERYLNKYNFKKSIIINDYHKFHRDKLHLIKEKDKYYLEKEYLNKIYKKHKIKTLNDQR